MSKLNIWLTVRLPRLGLSITLGLTFLLGLLLAMNGIPKTAQASAASETGNSGRGMNVVQATREEVVTSIETEKTQEVFTTVIVITPTAVSHEFKGAGVHIFDSDYHSPVFTSTLDALGLKYIRIQFGPDWDNISSTLPISETPSISNTQTISNTQPPPCNDETHDKDSGKMYDFIERNFDGDSYPRRTNAISTSKIAQNLGIETIFLNWRAHENWLTDTKTFRELKEEYVDDYACFVTESVKYLTDQGVQISYLEPTNEPSITETTKIPPELYNTFVISLATYLDQRNLSEVKILGPGLAYLNHDNTGITWTMALDDGSVTAISGWASHAWDPEFFTNTREVETLRMKWKEFHRAIKDIEDPDQPKPIFVTEYACVNDPGNGICAVENTLTLIDNGANAIVYWYLRKQIWDMDRANHKRALLTATYAVSPTYTALSSVLPFISGDEVKVLKTQVDGRITAASFHEADNGLGGKQVTVILANSFSETETVLIDFTEFDAIEVENMALYNGTTNTTVEDSELNPCLANSGRTRCQLSLQPNTIMTLVFRELLILDLPIIMKGD